MTRTPFQDNSDILARKEQGRRDLARLPFGEKIARMEALRERLDPMKRARGDRRSTGFEYRDFYSDVDAGSGVRPARNSVEDRTNAEVMRRDGVADAEIERRFGYLPEPVGDGPWRNLRKRSPRSSQDDGSAGGERRRSMEPG